MTGANVFVGDCEGRASHVRRVGPVHSAFFVQVSRPSDRQDRQVGARGFLLLVGVCLVFGYSVEYGVFAMRGMLVFECS